MLETYRSLTDPFAVLDISLWILTIILAFSVAIFTVIKMIYNPSEMSELQKKNVGTWVIVFIFLGFANIFNILYRYVILDENIVAMLDNISVLFVNIALFVKILQTENAINTYKFYKGYYFSVATFLLMIFTFIVTPNSLREIGPLQYIYLILLLFGGSIFPLIFLYLSIKLTGDERKMAIRMLTGALFFSIGLLFQPANLEAHITVLENHDILYNSLLIICPILISIAIIMMLTSYLGVL